MFDYVTCADSRYLPLSSEYVEDEVSVYTRTNMDSVMNAQGQRMIDICKMCNLRIMNGRFGANESISKYTRHTYNGSSTGDYSICSPDLFCFSLYVVLTLKYEYVFIITLLSVLGKLFTHVLNNRLDAWAEI